LLISWGVAAEDCPVLILAEMSLVAPPAPEPSRALLMRCHECDLLQRVGSVPPDTSAMCSRCGGTLFAYKPHGFERAFILYLAALLLLVIANAFPFLTLKVQLQSSHFISGAIDLYRKG
jgi:paraquat-inducible protein A